MSIFKRCLLYFLRRGWINKKNIERLMIHYVFFMEIYFSKINMILFSWIKIQLYTWCKMVFLCIFCYAIRALKVNIPVFSSDMHDGMSWYSSSKHTLCICIIIFSRTHIISKSQIPGTVNSHYNNTTMTLFRSYIFIE